MNARRRDRATPLHLTSLVGDSRMIALLVSHGADTQAWDAHGRTPANLAEMMHREASLIALKAQLPGLQKKE